MTSGRAAELMRTDVFGREESNMATASFG